MRYNLVILLLALVLITAGCTTTKTETAPAPTTISLVATPAPEPTVTPPQPGVDPIIGTWDNGLVFNPDGSVGDSGNMTWRANDMVNYSYFVTTETRKVTDVKSGVIVEPSALSKEWIYNPYSDTIHIRDTAVVAHRVLPGTVIPAPTAT